ncbi:MAG: cytochrome b/b6 domain-containing protein [Hyphomicrobiaceae bacterium]|nr:cytochrome b/b6 domain-containing protein [Hyphomicrobiaceae bacterium]
MPKPVKTDPATTTDDRVPVWDPAVRLFHWSLVSSVAIAWFTANKLEALHYWAGYAAAALIAFRLAWGIIGTHYARFHQFVRPPATILTYLKSILTGREARYLGHNPAGGAMILALILMLAATATTGWLMTTDAFWGSILMQRLHDLAANLLVLLVFIHIGGVVVASLRHKENLVGAMLSGRKRRPGPGDVV